MRISVLNVEMFCCEIVLILKTKAILDRKNAENVVESGRKVIVEF
jgi:hypothetical protein